MPKLRLLVLIVAYYAERTIEKVVRRIPRTLLDLYDVEILIIDDGSRDATFAEGVGVAQQVDLPFKVTVLHNPINQGYGGNQKIGYPYLSDEQSWWEAFFYIEPIRVYTSLFYHVGYLLSQAIGMPGSYLGYQIVFGLLLWGRAVLLFLIIYRTLPDSLWLAFTAGAIELFHAADGVTNWLGQINQHNYIFWLHLCLYCMVEAFRGTRPVIKIALSVAAAIALYLCMWSYEAAITLASITPVFILVGGKLARRQRVTWLGRSLSPYPLVNSCMVYI